MLFDTLKEPPNFNDDPHFHFIVTELFTKLELVNHDNIGEFQSITSKKRHIVEEFIKNWKHYVGLNIYPAVRLIFPAKDGRLYFLKDVAFARLITKMLKIPKNSIDYKRVNDWKKNYHNYKKLNSDRKKLRALPVILAQQVSERRLVEPKGDQVSIQEVNEILDKLATAEIDTLEQQIELLEPFINKLSTEELRWFFQIILKDSMIAPMEGYFYYSWHPDAIDFSHVVNNLRVVFWRLTDVTERLLKKELNVYPMYPFLPQLAEKPKISYEDLAAKMENEFYIEEKIDGDRMVIHMIRNPEDKNDMHFKYYTRRCKDYSMLYGSDLSYGSSKHLRNAFDDRVNSIILDGEMVAWDYRRNVILPFGTLKASAVQEAVRQFTTEDVFAEQSAWPFYIIYDILYLNGTHLSGIPLKRRRNILKDIIKNIPHRFEVLDTPIGHTAQDIEDAMRKAVLERSEGLMIKNVNLKYKIAMRDNSWVKIKPEYLEQFGENLDLCIIGVIKGVKNAFMCALRDDSTESVGLEEVNADDRFKYGTYKSFCTVANGFSEGEYDEILRLTEGKWHSFKDEKPPDDRIEFGTKKPDLWILPEDSLVLEIKARSIDSEPLRTYAVGTTLHNLYCRKLREDKSYIDCITVAEYREIKQLHSKSANKDQKVIKSEKKFDRKGAMRLRLLLNTIKVKVESTLFAGYTFLVLSDKLNKQTGDNITISQIKELIKKYGGTISLEVKMAKVFEQKFICISEKLTLQARNILENGIDLVKPEWVFQCIRYKSVLPMEPSLIFRSRNSSYLNDCKRRRLDEFGDSYILHVDQPILEYSNDLLVPKVEDDIKQEDEYPFSLLNLLKQELPMVGIETTPIVYLFSGVFFYVVRLDSSPTWEIEGFTRKVTRYSGNITDILSEASFIVFLEYDKYEFSKDQEMQRKAKVLSIEVANSWSVEKKIPYMVHESFVDDSIKNRVLVDPQDYKI